MFHMVVFFVEIISNLIFADCVHHHMSLEKAVWQKNK